jgi:DNA-directed RNA polymerase subunit beta'
MKRRQELSMRSTIIPEPAMHLDHVGLPKDAAMELYKPFVVRELPARLQSDEPLFEGIKEGKEIAWRALEKAMDKRPILLKRDPALHKFSIMAFKPKMVEGKAIQIHPLVTAGYNADFDGDTMSAFVPLTDEAVREAHKMFPSNNLFSSTTAASCTSRLRSPCSVFTSCRSGARTAARASRRSPRPRRPRTRASSA